MAMDVREKIVELLTEFYGVDPMYLGAGTNALIEYLIAKGVTAVVRCKDCIYSYEEFGFILYFRTLWGLQSTVAILLRRG